MGLVDRLKSSSAATKIGITWSLWATLTLSGYYFFRIYTKEHQEEALGIRQGIADQLESKIESARSNIDPKKLPTDRELKSSSIWNNSVKSASRS